jgi:hypothetical protein
MHHSTYDSEYRARSIHYPFLWSIHGEADLRWVLLFVRRAVSGVPHSIFRRGLCMEMEMRSLHVADESICE